MVAQDRQERRHRDRGARADPALADLDPRADIRLDVVTAWPLPEIALPASDLTIGFQDQAPRVRYYRVTGKGTGVSPNAEVILQSTYFR